MFNRAINTTTFHPTVVKEAFEEVRKIGRVRVCDCCGLRVLREGDTIVVKRGVINCFHTKLTN